MQSSWLTIKTILIQKIVHRLSRLNIDNRLIINSNNKDLAHSKCNKIKTTVLSYLRASTSNNTMTYKTIISWAKIHNRNSSRINSNSLKESWPNKLSNSSHNNKWGCHSRDNCIRKVEWEETLSISSLIITILSNHKDQTLQAIRCCRAVKEMEYPVISTNSNGKSWEKWFLVWSNSPRLNHLTISWKCKKKIFKTITETWKSPTILQRMRIQGLKLSYNRFRPS